MSRSAYRKPNDPHFSACFICMPCKYFTAANRHPCHGRHPSQTLTAAQLLCENLKKSSKWNLHCWDVFQAISPSRVCQGNLQSSYSKCPAQKGLLVWEGGGGVAQKIKTK